MKKFILCLSLVFSDVIYSSELMPLNEFIKTHSHFFNDANDTEYLANRCSALYFVLGSHINEISNTKDIKSIAKSYSDKADYYNKVSVKLSKVSTIENFQKEFAQNYNELIFNNWKGSGDLFKDLIGDDLNICDGNYPYFKKLAIGLTNK